jgi:uncharacterized membrane protein HdeD (DUF308 family)
MVETLTRNWSWVLLRGLVAILFGLLTLFNPGITLATLVLLFGAYALVDGAFMVVAAIANRRGQPRWGSLLAGGVLGIAAGAATILMPRVTAILLLALIATWAIVVGAAEIVVAIRVRKEIEGEWAYILAGSLAVMFGVFLVTRPHAGALVIGLWIGVFALVSGVTLTASAFRLRSWARAHESFSEPHPV